ncbi:HAD-IA family hydrolase [Thorsellia anophelis]|uniref:Putative hydrolase of the HAD superfamily n=1 Tax=Thorsellia anophelis DSM 18579 TaxID=1123402 RepID=A0A1I0B6C3_9GAMM|nr:HAD-IA family hydrolase [Thorsellia anophelis]SET02074.1 putative hydrolase of the HAD superfamily [Thorsellia anophelis DSM 18579]
MLYIFDLGNVLIDIDFNRVLGVWSHLSATPLHELQSKFSLDENFARHEKALLSDEAFAQAVSEQLGIYLSFEQFIEGWNAIFIGIRPGVLDLVRQIKAQGHRVVMLSNTNLAHTLYWQSEYPEVLAPFDHVYLSHEIGMRKPDKEIYEYVLNQEGYKAEGTIFFDDNQDNINGAKTLGIESVLVSDKTTIERYLKSRNIL